MMDGQDRWGILRKIGETDRRSLLSEILGRPIVSREAYIWSPGKELTDVMPSDSGLDLICEIDSSGNRRFAPVDLEVATKDTYKRFFTNAWVSGFEILQRTALASLNDEDARDTRQTHRLMWFLFQRARKTNQFIRRQFRSVKDLRVPSIARDVVGKTDLLPWSNGKETNRAGYPQSVDELLDYGAKECQRIGIVNPLVADKIHHGLAAVARLNPGPMPADELAARRVQHVLFDVQEPPDELTAQKHQEVEQAMCEAFWPYVNEDVTQEQFNKRFWGSSNSFVKEMARMLPGGECHENQEIANAVLAEFGWQSYSYVANCIEAVMRDVEKGIAESLNEGEQQTFKLLFYPQDFLGGMPLILLGEKLTFVHGIVRDLLLSAGDTQSIRSLHQLLVFYVAMVQQRREVDRVVKAHNRVQFTLDEDRDSPPIIEDASLEIDDADFLECVYARIRELQKVCCRCERPNWETMSMPMKGKKRKTRFQFVCRNCGTEVGDIEVSHTQLERIMEKLR